MLFRLYAKDHIGVQDGRGAGVGGVCEGGGGAPAPLRFSK